MLMNSDSHGSAVHYTYANMYMYMYMDMLARAHVHAYVHVHAPQNSSKARHNWDSATQTIIQLGHVSCTCSLFL